MPDKCASRDGSRRSTSFDFKWDRILFGISFVLVYCFTVIQANTLSDVNNLHTDLLKGYNKDIRPPIDQSTTIVNASFSLVSIRDFDEVSGKFAVTGVFIGVWFDDRLSWNPIDYNMTFTTTIPQDKIWKPTVFLANVIDSLKSVGQDFVSIRLYYYGLAIWTPPDIIETSCQVDVTYFPYDQQTCTLQFVSYSSLATEVLMNSAINEAMTPYYTEHGTWDLEKTATSSYVFDSGSMFEVHITINRRPLFFLVNIIFPVISLTLLNSFVFLLPAESGERISYAITVLLAIAVFMTMISNYLPKTSQTMARLCYFLIGDLVLSSVICILTIFQLRIFFKSDQKYPVPLFLRNIVTILKCQRIVHVHPKISESDAHNHQINQELCKPCDSNNQDITWKDIAKFFDLVSLFGSLLFQIVMLTVFFCVIT
ncbi:acetylcholine receptor subunit beta-like 1 [Mytilus californianus]|uniref:acetylcholine receptor subunit beta-like 1 n=1 Tax=Mytilus californianus TaxID=6549 RepID=UPI002247D757|nr:acetylcholine receptor subunit beta-like 1 [Mytilus californianus]